MTTHPAISPRLRHVATALVAASFFAAQAAQACPGCKNAIGGDGAGGSHTVNNVGVGYALSIGFMLFMLASVIGGIGLMAYRNCQALAAQHRAARRRRRWPAAGAERQMKDRQQPTAAAASRGEKGK